MFARCIATTVVLIGFSTTCSGDGVGEVESFSLAEKISWLYANVPTDDGGPWRDEDVSHLLRLEGYSISAGHLRHLRTGVRTGTRHELLARLSALFQIPLAYWSDPLVEQFVRERGAQDAAIARTLTERFFSLSEQDQARILAVLDKPED